MSEHRPAAMDLRNALHQPADTRVRVVFLDSARVPVFECDPCEELLRWTDGGVWSCPVCEYELTPYEAVEVLDLAVKRLWLIRDDVGRKVGGRWPHRVGRWFARIILHWSS